MNFMKGNRFKLFVIIIGCALTLTVCVLYYIHNKNHNTLIMGGSYSCQSDTIINDIVNELITADDITGNKNKDDIMNEISKYVSQSNEGSNDTNLYDQKRDVETYYRPSKRPVLNDRSYNRDLTLDYYKKDFDQLTIAKELLSTKEDTLLNYFSLLRDASNPVRDKGAGCGTIGYARTPYPFAYKFLSEEYQKKLSYEDFLKSFENILHISLIKYHEIPVYNNTNEITRYFVEIETIEGSDKSVAYFAYYYGFIDIIKEGDEYKISNTQFTGENYLCAPFHGWHYMAEAVVDIEYGYWCNLIKERYPTEQEDYIKKIYFSGTDGNDYLIVFFQLTNDTDIQIAQYRKEKDGNWNLIQFDPQKCLEDKKKQDKSE